MDLLRAMVSTGAKNVLNLEVNILDPSKLAFPGEPTGAGLCVVNAPDHVVPLMKRSVPLLHSIFRGEDFLNVREYFDAV